MPCLILSESGLINKQNTNKAIAISLRWSLQQTSEEKITTKCILYYAIYGMFLKIEKTTIIMELYSNFVLGAV